MIISLGFSILIRKEIFMTRGTFYLVLEDGTIYQSMEFNGDMYLASYGWGVDAYKFLEKYSEENDYTFESFVKLIKEFNSTHHKYDDIDEGRWVYNRGVADLKELIQNQYSDYSYIFDVKENKIIVYNYNEILDDSEVNEYIEEEHVITIKVDNDTYNELKSSAHWRSISIEEYVTNLIKDNL